MRVNIYNSWNTTYTGCLTSSDQLKRVSEITVNFTVTGLGGGAAADTATTAPATGNAPMAIAATVVVIAGAAMVATKKRT
jgi:hypothetical protein